MATFDWGHPWSFYAIWTAVSFLATFVMNSFCEYALHRWVLHQRRALLPYPYEKHDRMHHIIFRADETYVAKDEYMRNHVRFTPLDYILILLANLPISIGFELATGRPWIVGGFLATLTGLVLFDVLHWKFHNPSDTWFQRTRAYRFLREHHRLHHFRTDRNFNVNCFPLADVIMGTLITKEDQK